MPVPTVTLSGEALRGDRPGLSILMAAGPPLAVKLGRRRPAARPMCPRLSAYLSPRTAAPPPAKVDYAAKAMTSLSRMYLNDQYGDCVIAGKYHAVGTWTGNDSDSGGVAVGTDAEVLQQYHQICGPGDNGCVITDVLDAMKARGLPLAGRAHAIDGYVQVDWTNKTEVQVALYLFGALTLGINLPDAWLSAAVWDVTNSGIVGGHDVTAVGYDDRGVQVSSWGRVYTITWAAFTSTRWLEECYALLSPDWYGNDKLAPCGLDAKTLADDLAKLGGGTIPPIDPTPVPPVPPAPPVPPSPPVPPVPPSPPVPPVPDPTTPLSITMTGTVQGPFGSHPVSLTGQAVPSSSVPVPDAVEIDLGAHNVAGPLHDFVGTRIMSMLSGWGLTGFTYAGGVLRGARSSTVTPDQWAKIIQLILTVLPMILAIFGV